MSAENFIPPEVLDGTDLGANSRGAGSGTIEAVDTTKITQVPSGENIRTQATNTFLGNSAENSSPGAPELNSATQFAEPGTPSMPQEMIQNEPLVSPEAVVEPAPGAEAVPVPETPGIFEQPISETLNRVENAAAKSGENVSTSEETTDTPAEVNPPPESAAQEATESQKPEAETVEIPEIILPTPNPENSSTGAENIVDANQDNSPVEERAEESNNLPEEKPIIEEKQTENAPAPEEAENNSPIETDQTENSPAAAEENQAQIKENSPEENTTITPEVAAEAPAGLELGAENKAPEETGEVIYIDDEGAAGEAAATEKSSATEDQQGEKSADQTEENLKSPEEGQKTLVVESKFMSELTDDQRESGNNRLSLQAAGIDLNNKTIDVVDNLRNLIIRIESPENQGKGELAA